jgi:hypothetical protein
MKLFNQFMIILLYSCCISYSSSNNFHLDLDSPEIEARNFLWKETSAKHGLESIANNVVKWRENLKQEINHLLQALPQESKKKIVEKADKLNVKAWESLKVSDYIMFARDGNRDIFQKELNSRREKVIDLVVAELLTNNGKYMDQVANGLWLILEESTWVYPAHIGAQKAGEGLPDPKVTKNINVSFNPIFYHFSGTNC